MLRPLLLTFALTACTVQSAQRSDPSAQERLEVRDARPRSWGTQDTSSRKISGIADPRLTRFGGQSGEPGPPPTDDFDSSPSTPTAPPTTDTDSDVDGALDSDGNGIPDNQDPDFEGNDTSDTGDTGE